MSLPRVAKVYATAKQGHVSLELDCCCLVAAELTDQHRDNPNVLLGTTRPLHRCGGRGQAPVQGGAQKQRADRRTHAVPVRYSADSEIALGERIGRQQERLASSGDAEEVVSGKLN